MSDNKKPNNPNAFPTMDHGFDRQGCPIVSTYEGMTLRDYFANSALPSIMISQNFSYAKTPEQMAETAYVIADAMLKQREL